jgi:hypothetical protein
VHAVRSVPAGDADGVRRRPDGVFHHWSDWAQALGWSGFGNLIGGIGLVTSLRLLQAPHRVAEERADQS